MARHILTGMALACVAALAAPAPAQAPAQSQPNGSCGAGTIPGPGGGCMHIPQNNYPQQQRYDPPPVSQPQIQMRPYVQPKLFAVHVTDVDRTALYSANMTFTLQESERLAINHCEEKTGRKCVVLGGFSEQCQAIVIGPARQTYKGLDLLPRPAARDAMASCARDHPVGQCRLWRQPLCTGFGYRDVQHAGRMDDPRSTEEIEAAVNAMTAEIAAELRGGK